MNSNFGEELSLSEILSDEEKEHDRFVRSAPGSNFGPELSLEEVLNLLYTTALPARAGFWEKNDRVVKEAIHTQQTHLEIGDFRFKIEYFAQITSVRKYDFSAPRMYLKVHPNGKGPVDDPQSSNRNQRATGSPSDSDV